MSPTEFPGSLKAPTGERLTGHSQWAALAIRKVLASIENEAKNEVLATEKADLLHLMPVRGSLQQDDDFKDEIKEFNIGIIGAGAAGLFTAMILDYLNKNYNLNAKYEILEANDEDRLGGRLYTYFFNVKDNEERKHQYFDVGAMRFPEIKTMDRTFQLLDKVGMKAPVNPKDPQPGDLITYYMAGKNCPKLYNGVQTIDTNITAKTFGITGLSETIAATNPDELIAEKISYWVKLYPKDPALFWEGLTSEVDQFSVRQYLTNKGFDYNTIEYLETIESGNRWYDQGVSEMILESIDFDHDKPWKCVEGGAQQIAKHMLANLNPESFLNPDRPVLFKKSVKAISYVQVPEEKPHGHDGTKCGSRYRVQVNVRGEDAPRTYHTVFNSAPLGAMQHMQLEGLNLDWDVKRAIRNLGYGASCKVGIRFKTLWWLKEPYNITEGGVAKTDLPIRTCVYPSYNVHDDDPDREHRNEPGVLLASYTWSQEANRIGALIDRATDKTSSTEDEEELKELLLHDLARLHTPTSDPKNPFYDPNDAYQKTYAFLADQYLDHYAWDWYADRHAVGAFAYFGPGQFQHMYPAVTKTDGKHVIIGEAASAHHAWVVGALESAVRGVYQFLFKHSKRSTAAHKATEAYNNDKIPGPFGPLPYEYDRTKEVLVPGDLPCVGEGNRPEDIKNSGHLPPAVGEIARAQVVFESARLRQGTEILDPAKITEDDVVAFTRALEGLSVEDIAA
ncbi:hypothetical protein B0H66DRAFT_217430 [Apodospora peruviana]|uniref:Amine oxidase domain-containing protein n=1 Tax=Apodospora peruviana TaxID=516989 RepID=A0AAE0IDE1_9PEZI|nr:hypothetical protein B0H66DRAFT_217430 [Apodospora peruviana]